MLILEIMIAIIGAMTVEIEGLKELMTEKTEKTIRHEYI